MRDVRGFTLVEILVVVAIMGVLMSFAVPNFIDWQRSSTYREAARNLHDKMRLARNLAIEQNTEFQVEVNVAGNRARINRGNRSSNSSVFIPETGWEWLANVGNGYVLRSGAVCTSTDDVDFHFNTNGSASTSYVCIMTADPVPVKSYRVGINIASTGRAVTQKHPWP